MKRSREDASPSVGPKEGDASPVDVDCKKDEAARGAAGDFDTRCEPIFFTASSFGVNQSSEYNRNWATEMVVPVSHPSFSSSYTSTPLRYGSWLALTGF